MTVCVNCTVESIKDEEGLEICPVCGLVINDFFVDAPTTNTNQGIEEISSVVMQSKVAKDSSGKFLTYTQRNVAKRLKNWQKRMRLITPKERINFNLNIQVDKITNNLSLAPKFKDEIFSIYNNLREKGLTKGKSIATAICAITYIVCIKHKLAISFDDIVSTTELKKKKVSRIYKAYIKEVDTGIELPESSNFVKKYIFYGQLTPAKTIELTKIVNHILDLTKQASKMGKGPNTYVSALVYFIMKILGEDINLKQYMQKAKISNITINTKIKLIMNELAQFSDEQLKYFTKEQLEDAVRRIFKTT